MKAATINYPQAVSHDAALKLAAIDDRWSEGERMALAAIAGDPGNGGRMQGSGRLFEANGMKFVARYADRGVNLRRQP